MHGGLGGEKAGSAPVAVTASLMAATLKRYSLPFERPPTSWVDALGTVRSPVPPPDPVMRITYSEIGAPLALGATHCTRTLSLSPPMHVGAGGADGRPITVTVTVPVTSRATVSVASATV